MTIHVDVMHAVTRVTDGARYSLLVVDAKNGLGDNSSNIQIIDKTYFQRQKKRETTTRESSKKDDKRKKRKR